MRFLEDLFYRDSVQPFVAITRVVAGPGAINAQETSVTVNAQLAAENFRDMLPELLVSHFGHGH
jgi:hypothetical protein